MADTPEPPPSSPPSLPPTERLYLEDTYQFSLPEGAHVLAVLREPDAKAGGRPRTAVVLDRTIFHPQGGGQPADQGAISLLRHDDGAGGSVKFAVEAVRDDGTGVLRHYGAFVRPQQQQQEEEEEEEEGMMGFGPRDEVALEIDARRRRLHARLHSAGHALDVAMARLGLGGDCLKPTKGYHFSEGPYVEYAGELPPQYAAEPQALVAALNAEMGLLVEEGLETKVHTLPKAEAGELLPGGPGELAHLPDDKDVRIAVVAGGRCPCGGTHVKSAAEIGKVEVTRIKATPKKRLVKVSYQIDHAADADGASEAAAKARE